MARQPPPSTGLPRQEYWRGCHVLHQGIFPTRGWNLSLLWLLQRRQILYHCATRLSAQLANVEGASTQLKLRRDCCLLLVFKEISVKTIVENKLKEQRLQ